jgi:hypothetical protein
MEPRDYDDRYLTLLHINNILKRDQFDRLTEAQKIFFKSPVIYTLAILQSNSGEYLFPVTTMLAWTDEQRDQFKKEATYTPEEHRDLVDSLTENKPENAIIYEKDLTYWINFDQARSFFDNNDPNQNAVSNR